MVRRSRRLLPEGNASPARADFPPPPSRQPSCRPAVDSGLHRQREQQVAAPPPSQRKQQAAVPLSFNPASPAAPNGHVGGALAVALGKELAQYPLRPPGGTVCVGGKGRGSHPAVEGIRYFCSVPEQGEAEASAEAARPRRLLRRCGPAPGAPSSAHFSAISVGSTGSKALSLLAC